MPKHGKRFRALAEKVDATQTVEPRSAAKLVKELATAKFDETLEVHIRTGLDPRHADQVLRSSVVLPAGTGRTQRVLVFAEGDGAREAEAAGADFVGSDDLLAKIQGGWTDFDVAVATPDLMGKVGRVARILGPRGLMPNPRSNTVTTDLTRTINEIKGGRVEFRVDRGGVVHGPLGKASFTEEQIMQNLSAFIDEVVRSKPAGAKGVYIKSITLTPAMGPGIRLEIAPTLALAASQQ